MIFHKILVILHTNGFISSQKWVSAVSNFSFFSFTDFLTVTRPSWAQKEIVIFPNPAKEFISINHLNENSLITITDLSGRVVKQTRSLNTNQIISTSDLNDGVYMIAVQNNQQHVITKLIINK